MTAWAEIAPAKLNLALHVRGRLPDGRHDIETIFAFCTDGDRLTAEPAQEISLAVTGPFSAQLAKEDDNLVLRAAHALSLAADVRNGAALTLDKRLPVASGIGGGSADAAAALRLLTSMWQLDPAFAQDIAPKLGSDVPACLLSLPACGTGAGDRLSPFALQELSNAPVLLVNPNVAVSTAAVFARWDGKDRGPLGSWQHGRNDLQEAAIAIAPEIKPVLAWLCKREGVLLVRMSGSGATCFAIFNDEQSRNSAAEAVPREWWRLATYLR